MHGRPDNVPEIVSALEDCATNISAWCVAKRLELNAEKTGVLWFGAAANLRKISSDVSSIRVGSTVVKRKTDIHDLGVMLDAELSMREHVSQTGQSCFHHLCRLRSVHHCPTSVCIIAFVLLRLDYCNIVLAGLPASTLAPLQWVLHAASLLVLDLQPHDHISQALRELHWLLMDKRIKYTVPLGPQGVDWAGTNLHHRHVSSVQLLSNQRSATNGDYIIPRTRRKLGERAFSVAAPKAWNRLPTELKTSSCSIDSFKRSSKSFLRAVPARYEPFWRYCAAPERLHCMDSVEYCKKATSICQ